MTDIMPTIVMQRWAEANANPSMFRWRSLAEMCSALHIQHFVACRHAIADDMSTLANLAFQNYLDMQPENAIEEAT